ncbi:MAG: ABC transporter substrate-binding protein [Desulfuromonadaceae bacterium]
MSIRSVKPVLMTIVSLLMFCSLASAAPKTAPKDAEGNDILKAASVASRLSVNPLELAGILGYLKEAKIKLQYVGALGSSAVIPALLSGGIDIGNGHIPRAIGATSRGARLKAVAASSHTTKEKPHMTYMVLENSPIKTYKDLVGKRVTVAAWGGCNEYTAYEYVRTKGVKNPKQAIKTQVVTPGTEETVLRTNNTDVAGIHQSPDILLKRPGWRVLFTDYDIWGGVGGNAPHYMTDDFIKANPDLVRRFVGVIAKTNNFMNKNPLKARQLYAEHYKLKLENVSINYYEPDAILQPNTISLWNDILLAYGDIKKPVPIEKVYTNEFNPYYKKKL